MNRPGWAGYRPLRPNRAPKALAGSGSGIYNGTRDFALSWA